MNARNSPDEIRIETVRLTFPVTFLCDDTLVPQALDDAADMISSDCPSEDLSVSGLDRLAEVGVTVFLRLVSKDNVECLTMLCLRYRRVCVELSDDRPSRLLLIEAVTSDYLRHGDTVADYAECKRRELRRSRISGTDNTDVRIVLVFLHEHDRLGFVGKLRTEMSACILVRLVLMKYGVNMELVEVCPLHQQRDYSCRFRRVVNVMEQIPHAVNDDKPDVG